ncbi:MAG: hypothetical protein AAFV72_05150 [Cyanobacteria bacterium J06635_1]
MHSVVEVQSWLTESYGFPIPRLFAEATQLVLTFMAEGYEDTFEYLGWELTPALHLFGNGQQAHEIAYRYDWTPLELFSFGWSGSDGEHYGYLIHAPELHQLDYPIVEYGPMNDFGIIFIGRDTRSGLEGLLSLIIESEYATALHKHRDLVSALELRPSVEKTDWYQNWKAFIPEVPEGWRYEPSSDGVGVLAPVPLFSPEHSAFMAHFDRSTKLTVADLSDEIESVLEMAQTALDGTYPATALAMIRESYWQIGDSFHQYAPLWRQTYLDLGRPLLATAVDHALKDRQVVQNHNSVAKAEAIVIAFREE